MNDKATCPDCGSAPVNHRLEWWSNWFEHWTDYFFGPLDTLRYRLEPILYLLPWNQVLLSLFWVGSKLGIIQIHNNLLPTDSSRTICLWDAAGARGITMQRVTLLGQHTEICIARHRDQTKIFMSMPRPSGPPSQAFAWMDNKSVMQQKFIAVGLPVPKGRECSTWVEARSVFREINGRVIVKPTLGSRSRHTTVGISTEDQLKEAYDKAKQISSWVMVEQELPGMVYRVIWVGSSVIAVMRREPAYVTGNGQLTIRELAERENQNSLRHGPIFHTLPINKVTTHELARQGLGWSTVPAAGQIVILNPKVSRGNGAVNVDVTDIVHPDNIELFKKIGSFVNDPLIGIDFIIQDITRPWPEQLPCGVIECNALPYVDLHRYPFAGPVRDAAGPLWELVFPGSGTTQSPSHSLNLS